MFVFYVLYILIYLIIYTEIKQQLESFVSKLGLLTPLQISACTTKKSLSKYRHQQGIIPENKKIFNLPEYVFLFTLSQYF